jgi:tRNA modification GTPase
MDDSTIAAIASPAGRGGISIIKISGPQAAAIAAALFRPAAKQRPDKPAGFNPESHRIHYGRIVDALTGRVIDEVLLSIMRAPRSYTREDVVEISTHGSPVAVRAILEQVLRQGARLAEPGEFTRRAFLNGRIDLTQAEAVSDLIQARSDRAQAAAAAQLGGVLRREIESHRYRCVDLLSRIEAGIDFPEDVDEILDAQRFARELRQGVVAPVQGLVQNYVDGRVIREGLTVAIVGRPNVGKSSLMNRLLDRERAIVTPYPGTTRDAIEEALTIDGLAVNLWDTAGLHDSGDPLEVLGMQKAEEQSLRADLNLFVLEAHCPLSAADAIVFEKIRTRPVVIVFNKIDLLSGSGSPPRLPPDWPAAVQVPVSALSGQGMEQLREAIIETAAGDRALETEAAMIPNLRQKVLLERCSESAEAACAGLENGLATDLVAIHLADAVAALDEMLGSSARPDILEAIFSRFCIGK